MTVQISTPDWVKHTIFYQIFPDRFAISSRVEKPGNFEQWDTPPTEFGFKGGDLLGVVEHLDYLEDLGINAIYINPIFQSASNHRYHTYDYYQVDPLLGGDAAFQELLDEAHHRGFRVILDGVFNHASRGFFQFNHILEAGEKSPYFDWFHVRGFPLGAYQGKPNYQCWFNLPALPEFNLKNPKVRKFLLEVARYWLEWGIDGWRLDFPDRIDHDFWQEFRQVVKEVNSEAYIVGEIPWDAQPWLQGDQFDAVINYPFARACLGFFVGANVDNRAKSKIMGVPLASFLDAPTFASHIEELLHLYPRENVLVQLNLLDSHDTPRFLSLAKGDKSALRLATFFQMTYPGTPCIYYGDEIGLLGGRDPGCRRTFPWDRTRWDMDLLRFVKGCIALRKDHPAFQTGDFISVYAAGNLYAYLRRKETETLVVIINNGIEPHRSPIPIGTLLPNGTHLLTISQGLWAKIGDARVDGGQIVDLELPPRSGVAFKPS